MISMGCLVWERKKEIKRKKERERERKNKRESEGREREKKIRERVRGGLLSFDIGAWGVDIEVVCVKYNE